MTEIIDVPTFGEVLLRAARQWSEREALVLPGERFTYAELEQRAREVARGLVAIGIKRGDHVGILMPNCSDFFHAFFGVALAGAIVVPINARYKRRELSYVIENADLVALLTSDIIDEHVDFVDLIGASLPGLPESTELTSLRIETAPRLKSVVLFGRRDRPGLLGREAFTKLAAGVPDAAVEEQRAPIGIHDVAAMPYTSGTTSFPKGCPLTHNAIVLDWILAGRRFGVEDGDRFWDPCPMFHMSGIGPMIFTFIVGGTFITATHFDPDTAINQIIQERANVIYPTFPPITMALLRHPSYDPEKLGHVKATLNVAPPETLRLMQEMLPKAIQISCYGITEGSGVITYNELTETLDERIYTTGPPLEGIEVKIVDPETLIECPTGDPGEILIRGFNTFLGYYKDPEKTAATFLSDGWVRTGDTGTVDKNGRVAYVGRSKDMLKVGGENVAPSEIESYMSTHPAVKLVQVVGRSDERYVEVPVAFVELSPGTHATAEDLIEFCRGQLASFKIPREVRFVTEWPMSATKIQKFKLREMLTEESS